MVSFRYVFGPALSKRFGFFLGINNIPHKICSYSCVYCQLGKTTKYTIDRKPLSDVDRVIEEVKTILASDVNIDYVVFFPCGEPTLDRNIGCITEKLKSKFDIPVAIVTNASLLWRDDVVADLMAFDLVSIKVDAVTEETWRLINRPHRELDINRILQGVKHFAEIFRGEIVTETMLVRGLNTSEEELSRIAEFLRTLHPSRAYILAPTRPPSERWILPPRNKDLIKALNIFSAYFEKDEISLLSVPEFSEFIVLDDPKKYFLSLVGVYPLRLEFATRILSKEYEDPQRALRELIDMKLIRIISYGGKKFLIKRRDHTH